MARTMTATSSIAPMTGIASGMRSIGETMYAPAMPSRALRDGGTRGSVASAHSSGHSSARGRPAAGMEACSGHGEIRSRDGVNGP